MSHSKKKKQQPQVAQVEETQELAVETLGPSTPDGVAVPSVQSQQPAALDLPQAFQALRLRGVSVQEIAQAAGIPEQKVQELLNLPANHST